MNPQSRVLKWSLIIGLVIVINLFFNYALSLVYKEPDFNNFCPQEQVVNVPQNQNECVKQGGQWTENPSYMTKPVPAGEPAPSGYCNLQFTCGNNYNDAMKGYNRNIFVILVVLGAIIVAIGSFFASNAVIASGLSLAGVLSFIIASIRYWGAASDLIRVIILGIALALLFWIAYKKFKNG